MIVYKKRVLDSFVAGNPVTFRNYPDKSPIRGKTIKLQEPLGYGRGSAGLAEGVVTARIPCVLVKGGGFLWTLTPIAQITPEQMKELKRLGKDDKTVPGATKAMKAIEDKAENDREVYEESNGLDGVPF